MVELYWLHPRLGGDTTLASYGVDASGQRREKDVQADANAAVPAAHMKFLERLQLSHVVGDLMFVHAGIRPGVPIKDQTEEDLLWIRQEFHNHTGPHPQADRPRPHTRRRGYALRQPGQSRHRGRLWPSADCRCLRRHTRLVTDGQGPGPSGRLGPVQNHLA